MTVEAGCWDLLLFGLKSIIEVGHWQCTKRPSLQLAFQFIPQVLDEVVARALCRPVSTLLVHNIIVCCGIKVYLNWNLGVPPKLKQKKQPQTLGSHEHVACPHTVNKTTDNSPLVHIRQQKIDLFLLLPDSFYLATYFNDHWRMSMKQQRSISMPHA